MNKPAIASLGDFLKFAQTAPPAPVIFGALARLTATALADHVHAIGPSDAFLTRMEGAGFDTDRARAFFDWVVDDALLRTEVH